MNVFDEIKRALDEIQHGWTSVQKAHCMAAAIIALRPELSIEIGVFAGKGLIAMGLAHKEVGRGRVIGIDPYSPIASAEGQLNEADKEFWSKLDHEAIYHTATENIFKYGVNGFCQLVRSTSRDYQPADGVGVLRIDGNHGEQVLEDVARYAPKVRAGGILFLDDLGWTGQAVKRAAEQLSSSGWRELYRIDDGAAYQKV